MREPAKPDVAATPGGSGATTLTDTGESTAPSDGSALPCTLTERDPARYHIEAIHGHGGIGRVLRARDHELGRVLALKELMSSNPVAEARFEREIRLTARLEHPGIVPVHDAGRWSSDGRSFYTMKLVAGESLRERVAATRDQAERLALLPRVLAIADAVAYAHSRGIIHRDLKPANVIIGDYGETIVIDWGLAKEVGAVEPPAADEPPAAQAELTVAGAIVGTPSFMAPEQARGATVDERADVYALGAIAYNVLAGRSPYEGESSAEVLAQVALGPPLPLRQVAPGVPVDLAAIVEKAMARAPGARYPSARELAGDLRRFQAGRLVQAREYAWWEPTVRWLRRHHVIAALTALFVLVGVAGGLLAFSREQRLRRVAVAERGRAEAQTLSLLEQQARRELDSGRPRRAAVYLAEALRRAPGSRVLRALLTQAMLPSHAHVRTLLGHERDVVRAAFSPDGTLLATGSTDKTVRLWSVTDAQAPARILRGHLGSLEALSWSADGTLLASGDGKNVRVWRVADGTPLQVFDWGVKSLAFSPDAHELWGGSGEGQVRVVDVATGAERLALSPHGDRVQMISFDRSGVRAFTVSWDGQIIIWDVATHRELSRITDHRSPVWFMSFSQDGALALSGDEDGAIHVRDGHSLAILHTLQLPSAAHATKAWFSPDARTVVSASADGSLRVWHATGGKALETIDAVAEGKLFDAALSPDGGLVAVTSLRAVDLWRPAAGADFRVLAGGSHELTSFHPGALSGDGRRFVATRLPALGPPTMQAWDTTTGEIVGHWDETGLPYAIAITHDGAHVIIGDLGAPEARILDARTGARLATLRGHARMVYNLALSPDDAVVATASYDKTVRQWSAKDGTPIGAPIPLEVRPTALAFDPSRPRLAIALEDGSIGFYDRVTGARQSTFVAHATWIQELRFSPDGKRLLSAGRQDHLAKIWDLRGDAPPVVLNGHLDNLITATFSPDGSLVATVSVDDTARLWDAATGELERTISGPSHTAAFSPDGTQLYTTGRRDFAVVWGLGVDPRDAAVLAAEVDATSPWRLDGGRLVLRAPL